MIFNIIELLSSGLLYFTLHLGNTGSFPPPLPPAEEKCLLEKIACGDADAKRRLIEHNLRLVAHIIKKYYSCCTEQEDLISIGTIGLIKGINTFDSTKGARLATYAARCIENEILMQFRAQKKSSQDISISEPIDTDSEGNPLTLIDIISVEDSISDDLDQQIKTEQLYRYIDEIKNEREKTIVVLRYGLYNTEPHTQREVAKLLGISRSYVSRIEKKTLICLRKKFRCGDKA